MVVTFEFPLLNKGDFFLVKLLLSGSVPSDDMKFTLVADDLPRTLEFNRLPPQALEEKKLRVEWGIVVVGLVVLAFGSAMSFALFNLVEHRPDAFPYPWSTFKFSVLSLLVVAPSVIGVVLICIFGALLVIAAGLEGLWIRGTRFPLPKELRRRVFRVFSGHVVAGFTPDLDDEPDGADEGL